MSFSDDLEKFAAKAMLSVDELLQGVVLEMGGSIIDMSPVDSGRFRGNWQFGHNQMPTGTLSDLGPIDSDPKARLRQEVVSLKAGGIDYYVNNLPYGPRLEYGYSQQAPGGMVRVTAARFQNILRDELR